MILCVAFLCHTFVGAQTVTFGLISDVHEGLQKDAVERVNTFVKDATAKKVDFIIELGDLCHGVSGAKKILPAFNQYKGEKHHVLGNHDMETSTKKEMVSIYDMPSNYYYFDKEGVRFIILDCNFIRKENKLFDYDHGNFFINSKDRGFIPPEEITWTKKTICSTDKPCIIFSHQAFDEIGASVPNRQDFRQMLHEVNIPKKHVIAMVSGHHHIDAHSVIDNIDYVEMNSSSYQWIENGHEYSNGKMAVYKQALYAFFTIDVANKTVTIEGRRTVYNPPAPKSQNYTVKERKKNNEWKYLKPVITSRVIHLCNN